MAFCPNCRAEYLPHIWSCVDCEVDLVDHLPPEAPEEAPEELEPLDRDFETVYTDSKLFDAQMAQKILEVNGFRPKVIGQHEANYPPTGPFSVQVPAFRVDEAKALLEAYMDSDVSDFDVYEDRDQSPS